MFQMLRLFANVYSLVLKFSIIMRVSNPVVIETATVSNKQIIPGRHDRGVRPPFAPSALPLGGPVYGDLGDIRPHKK